MFSRADLPSVHPVGRIDRLPGLERVSDPRQEAFERTMATMLGKSLQGQVLSRLTDGSFIVKVAGTSARMMLPPGAQVGTQVPLTLVSVSPRPTFQIGNGQAGQGAVAYSEAGPALLPGPAGAAARATPLVYLDGAHVPARAPASPAAGTAGATPPAAPPASPAGPTPSPAVPPRGPEPQLAAQAALPQGGLDASLRTTSHAAALLGKAPIVPADQLPAIDPRSTPASLSEGAKVITSVLTTAMKAGNQPTSVVTTIPLLAPGTVAPEHIAAALKNAIGKSGLFYESHVAEWSEGKRALPELLREPQMQKAMASPEAAARQASPATDPATAQFINLQLSTQEQARIAWQGPVWPGQHMQWEIHKDAPERDHHGGYDDEGSRAWRSGVRFRFPLLGEIAANVVMVGDQLHIQVQAGSRQSGELLRAHAAELSASLEAAGTPLSSLDIRAAGDGSDG